MDEKILEEIIGECSVLRMYTIEECDTYFKNKKIVTLEELTKVNLMQFLMQRQDKRIRNEVKRNKN